MEIKNFDLYFEVGNLKLNTKNFQNIIEKSEIEVIDRTDLEKIGKIFQVSKKIKTTKKELYNIITIMMLLDNEYKKSNPCKETKLSYYNNKNYYSLTYEIKLGYFAISINVCEYFLEIEIYFEGIKENFESGGEHVRTIF